MRFSNAAGREGLSKPWYASEQNSTPKTLASNELAGYFGSEGKDVWGNEDPRRQEREQARITSNDPFAFMMKAQEQLKKSKEDKKKWAKERNRELRELRATHDKEGDIVRHHRRMREDEDTKHESGRRSSEKSRKRKHRRSRSRSHSRSRDGRRRRSPNGQDERNESRYQERDYSGRDRYASRSRRERNRDKDEQHRHSTRAKPHADLELE